jgi:tRNA(fMet)-specific endonuclease VapC
MTASSSILFDTSILIDYVRKRTKEQTVLYRLATLYKPCISVVTEFEFLLGKNDANAEITSSLLQRLTILPLDSPIVEFSVEIYQRLKRKNALIGDNDIFIAATALVFDTPIATLNSKHFSRLKANFGLQIIDSL